MVEYNLSFTSNASRRFELYLNKDGDIYIGEQTDDADDTLSSYVVISKEDWPEIKRFIDKSLKDAMDEANDF